MGTTDVARYYSNLPRLPKHPPSEGLPASGVMADPANSRSIIGIAYPYAHLGGFQPGHDPWGEYEVPEVIWRIVLDRIWSDGQVTRLNDREILDGRYVLRNGEFVELAEHAP